MQKNSTMGQEENPIGPFEGFGELDLMLNNLISISRTLFYSIP